MKIFFTITFLLCLLIVLHENTPFWLEDESIPIQEGLKRVFVVLTLIVWFEIAVALMWQNELGLG